MGQFALIDPVAGADDGSRSVRKCPKCDGNGLLRVTPRVHALFPGLAGPPEETIVRCEMCKATGRIITSGDGRIYRGAAEQAHITI